MNSRKAFELERCLLHWPVIVVWSLLSRCRCSFQKFSLLSAFFVRWLKTSPYRHPTYGWSGRIHVTGIPQVSIYTWNSASDFVRLYSPTEQNGVAERKYRHIVETGRALMIHARIPRHLWTEAKAVHIINRLPTSSVRCTIMEAHTSTTLSLILISVVYLRALLMFI